MFFQDLRQDVICQIEYQELLSGVKKVVGPVLSIDADKCLILSEEGEIVTIQAETILDAYKVDLDKRIVAALIQMKTALHEIFQLERTLVEMKDNLTVSRSNVHDAVFLSRFNLWGAKTRLLNSIPEKLLCFEKGKTEFDISFYLDDNRDLQISIEISDLFEHYAISSASDIEKAIRIYCPDMLKRVADVFGENFMFSEKHKRISHVDGSSYKAITEYASVVIITAETFFEIREKIIKALTILAN